MNLRLILGYVLMFVCVLALAAACFLAVNNLGGAWTMQVFWRPVTMPPPVWLLLAAVAGVVLLIVLTRLLPAAVRMVGRGREIRREHLLKETLKEVRQDQAASAASAGASSPAGTVIKHSSSPNPGEEPEKR